MTFIIEEKLLDRLCKEVLEPLINGVSDHARLAIAACFYPDDAIVPRCLRKSKGSYSIYFPTGLYNRLLLLLILINSADLDGSIMAKLSPTDKRDVINIIPGRLRCIFDPEQNLESGDAGSLLAEYSLGSEDLRNVSKMLRSAFWFLFYHEFSHIRHGHFELKKEFNRKPEAWNSRWTLGMALADLLEGLEVSADQKTGGYLAASIEGALRAEQEMHGGMPNIPGNVLWHFGVGLACAISLFDWRSRSLDVVVTHYPHPVIRWTIIQNAIREALGWDTEPARDWAIHSKPLAAEAHR